MLEKPGQLLIDKKKIKDTKEKDSENVNESERESWVWKELATRDQTDGGITEPEDTKMMITWGLRGWRRLTVKKVEFPQAMLVISLTGHVKIDICFMYMCSV